MAPLVRSGTFIEPRANLRYVFDVNCGVAYLGEINAVHWLSDLRDVPPSWAPDVDEHGEIVVSVRLVGGPDPHVLATANDQGIRYEPARAAPPPCSD